MASRAESRRAAGSGAISYGHRAAFWAGITAVTAGVLLHLPMFLDAARVHYRIVGMSLDAPIIIGMILIVVGLAATVFGLLTRPAGVGRDAVARVRVRALDDARIRPAHVALLVVMAVAVTIDVMKPTALGFVVPGFAKEYGLRSPNNPAGHPAAALLPLAAEVYPTRIRSRGTGLAAGASKAAGVAIIAVVAAAVAPPTIAVTALIGAIPMALAALAVLLFGAETRRWRLGEEITAEEFDAVAAA